MTTLAPKSLRGIIAACLTPFRDGRVDYDALEREFDYIVDDCRADAISIAAVEASEYTQLGWDERKELIRRGIELVRGRIPTIAGVSHPSPRAVLELAEHAAACGADLVQVLMPQRPWGGEPSPQETVAYFMAIAERSPLPLVAYHNPGPGADPAIPTLIELSKVDRIHYFKESSRDVTKIGRLIEEIDRTDNARYFTTMQPLLITLMLGGSGGTMPPPGAWMGARVVDAVRRGDVDEARTLARTFSVFPGRWGSYGLPPVMKAAMRHLGLDIGDVAPPYRPLSPPDDSALKDFLAASPLGRASSRRAAPGEGTLAVQVSATTRA
jgi:4-hydroxy-tetrahydrodipicolinate synthase